MPYAKTLLFIIGCYIFHAFLFTSISKIWVKHMHFRTHLNCILHPKIACVYEKNVIVIVMCSIVSLQWDTRCYAPGGPFYWHGLTWIPAWTSNYINYKMWDEITYPFPNFNCRTVDVWDWIISYHTLLGMWLLIHAQIKANPWRFHLKYSIFMIV